MLARGTLPDDWSWWARLLIAAAPATSQSAPVLWRRRSAPAWAALLVACGAAHAVEVGIGASTGSLFTPGQWAVLVALHGVGLTGPASPSASTCATAWSPHPAWPVRASWGSATASRRSCRPTRARGR